METEQTCQERIADQWESLREDLETYQKVDYQTWEELDRGGFEDLGGSQEKHQAFKALENIGDFGDYGLCFDWVEPDTFDNQPAGFYRWQIQFGGPQSEVRFFANGDVLFYFLDWFDGAFKHIEGTDEGKNLAQHFQMYEMMPLFDGVVRW